jgi:hypothetical protein
MVEQLKEGTATRRVVPSARPASATVKGCGSLARIKVAGDIRHGARHRRRQLLAPADDAAVDDRLGRGDERGDESSVRQPERTSHRIE